jgi:Holliday junction resolvase RusA-like endonuclease
MPTRHKDRHGKPHTSVPDTDNLAKLALDAMVRVGLISDDSKVSSLSVQKIWAREPGADFVVSPDLPVPIQTPALPPPDWVGGFG